MCLFLFALHLRTFNKTIDRCTPGQLVKGTASRFKSYGLCKKGSGKVSSELDDAPLQFYGAAVKEITSVTVERLYT